MAMAKYQQVSSLPEPCLVLLLPVAHHCQGARHHLLHQVGEQGHQVVANPTICSRLDALCQDMILCSLDSIQP